MEPRMNTKENQEKANSLGFTRPARAEPLGRREARGPRRNSQGKEPHHPQIRRQIKGQISKTLTGIPIARRGFQQGNLLESVPESVSMCKSAYSVFPPCGETLPFGFVTPHASNAPAPSSPHPPSGGVVAAIDDPPPAEQHVNVVHGITIRGIKQLNVNTGIQTGSQLH